MATARSFRPARAPSKKAFSLSRHKLFLLFIYMLAVLIYYPYVQEGGFSYLVFRVVGSAGIVLVLYAINLRRSLLICAVLLAVPALLERMLLFRADAGAFYILAIVLSFIFDVFVVVVIFRTVFTREEIDSEAIAGGLCIYLLVGFTFATVYGMIAALQPNAFYLNPQTNAHTVPSRFDFVYYSFATMTSVGASGMTPVTGQVRSMTIIEATLGVLYLAVLIARLIAAYRPPSKAPRN